MELRSLREAPSLLAVDPEPSAPTTSPTIPLISSLARTEKIEGLKPFSGNLAKLTSFLFLLQRKLNGNSDRYPIEEAQLNYGISCLTRNALEVVRPLIEQRTISTVSQLASILEASFGDPNRNATAQAKLY